MPLKCYDAIVVGTGGVGSAVLYHLAQRGAKVLGLDRFPRAHDRGSSHGRTRIIRQAYFEHPDYVPLLKRAYELWIRLEQAYGEQLYHEIGLMQIGPADGIVVPGVLESARRHQLPIELLSSAELRAQFRQFDVRDEWQGVLEKRAGYLRVEECVLAHLIHAQRHGAEISTGEEVVSCAANGQGVAVRTKTNTYRADKLVVTAGPWAGQLLRELAIPLEVRRKPQFWFACDDSRYRADNGCPTFLFETPRGIYYGFPDVHQWGVKAAQHTGGELVLDPRTVDRELRSSDQNDVINFLAAHLPGVSDRVRAHEVCMYTMSPDEHFIVDRHPRWPQICFAAGLSGHGFKFTSVLGEALAALALNGRTELPIDFLSLRRFG